MPIQVTGKVIPCFVYMPLFMPELRFCADRLMVGVVIIRIKQGLPELLQQRRSSQLWGRFGVL